jgi:hypothetical protein
MSDAAPVYTRTNIPIPDPSEITSREIAKAKAELREEFGQRLSAAIDEGSARRDGLGDRIVGVRDALGAVQADAGQRIANLQTLADDRLQGLTQLTNERIEGLKIAFREDKTAAATAVAAAFAAQEKLAIAQNLSNTAAIAKSEASTTKELESLDGKIASLKESIAADIRNLEGRLNRGEGGSLGARQQAADTHTSLATVFGFIGAVAGIVAVLVVTINLFAAHVQPSPTVVSPAVIPVGPSTR